MQFLLVGALSQLLKKLLICIAEQRQHFPPITQCAFACSSSSCTVRVGRARGLSPSIPPLWPCLQPPNHLPGKPCEAGWLLHCCCSSSALKHPGGVFSSLYFIWPSISVHLGPRAVVTALSLLEFKSIWTKLSGTWSELWEVLCGARSCTL